MTLTLTDRRLHWQGRDTGKSTAAEALKNLKTTLASVTTPWSENRDTPRVEVRTGDVSCAAGVTQFVRPVCSLPVTILSRSRVATDKTREKLLAAAFAAVEKMNEIRAGRSDFVLGFDNVSRTLPSAGDPAGPALTAWQAAFAAVSQSVVSTRFVTGAAGQSAHQGIASIKLGDAAHPLKDTAADDASLLKALTETVTGLDVLLTAEKAP